MSTITKKLFQSHDSLIPTYGQNHTAESDCIYTFAIMTILNDEIFKKFEENINPINILATLQEVPFKKRKLSNDNNEEKNTSNNENSTNIMFLQFEKYHTINNKNKYIMLTKEDSQQEKGIEKKEDNEKEKKRRR